ncbi:YigZ family protein [Borreliella yangtzensis]|uniref:Xaa-Pro dipeptidase n=1 Tax=Borreliella yangtzensis TaxID=683292 RepID=A0ABR6P831_9SPIR|nr:YigZ family protein [Borreliella yangtzensis]MBB6042423.1 Xaa-Pro dipeptidase [Borreliella yangtzensis]WKC73396.1 YigZ family protein [Borreliella yangtzensis]WKC74313.1 YigZ family protein [Borreliella yangtzensis]
MIFVPKNNSNSKIEIKKSIFVSYIFNIEKKEEINKTIKKYKIKFKNATHVVYGFRIGNNHSFLNGMSDDREPNLTAGKPTLDAIIHNNLTDTLIITLRYFGGTLLGRGGLIKAYYKSATEVIKNASIMEKEELEILNLNLNYNQYNSLLKMKNKLEIEITDSNFSNKINTSIKFKTKNRQKISEFFIKNDLIQETFKFHKE